jgi:4-hydroxyproline epimerase
MAQWFAKGLLHPGDTFIHESIIGSTFTGTIEGTTRVGNKEALFLVSKVGPKFTDTIS